MNSFILKYKKLFAIAFFMLALVSCGDEPDKILYKGPAFVFFESSNYVPILENSTTSVQIPVKVSEPQSEDFTIAYEIDAEGAVAGVDYTIVSPNPITIEAGEYTSFIEVEVIDNAVLDSEIRSFNITLTDISKSSLQRQVRTTLNVEVINDDCSPEVPKIVNWIGTVDIEDAGFGSVSGVAKAGPDGSCGGVLIVSDADIVQVGEDSRIVIAFTQDSGNPTTGTVTVARDRIFTNDAFSGYHYEGEGIYDEESSEILIDYTMYRPDGSVWFTGTTIITKP